MVFTIGRSEMVFLECSFSTDIEDFSFSKCIFEFLDLCQSKMIKIHIKSHLPL